MHTALSSAWTLPFQGTKLIFLGGFSYSLFLHPSLSLPLPLAPVIHAQPFLQTYKMVSESSWTVIAVTASVKEDERGSQGHTSASLLHQSTT
jgi:hypothetical protein